jgi:hypothetical protein
VVAADAGRFVGACAGVEEEGDEGAVAAVVGADEAGYLGVGEGLAFGAWDARPGELEGGVRGAGAAAGEGVEGAQVAVVGVEGVRPAAQGGEVALEEVGVGGQLRVCADEGREGVAIAGAGLGLEGARQESLELGGCAARGRVYGRRVSAVPEWELSGLRVGGVSSLRRWPL